MKIHILLVLLAVLSGCSSYDLVAQQSSQEYMPGVSTPTYSFNGSVPGPTLYATVNKPFEVTVKNTLPEPMTIHWHGVRLPNEMDGVPGVTQKPILPGDTFTYSFTPVDSGVYWYHSHVDAHKQVEMGLQGAFIVDDPAVSIPFDSDTVLVIDDVALNQDGSYISFEPNYMHGRFGNILLVNGKNRPVIDSQGELHRFRIVNTANARSFRVYFDGLNATVYAADIGYAQPYTTSVLTLHPGERYDIVVNSSESFSLSNIGRRNTLMATINVSKLPYMREKSSAVIPSVQIDSELYTRQPDMYLDLKGVRNPDFGLVWEINGTNSLSNPGSILFDSEQITKVRLRNTQGQPHPMHLHGQKFLILSRNGQIQTQQSFKDTVMVGSREVVDIAVIADNLGEWVFHCHILEHAKAGMLTTVHVE